MLSIRSVDLPGDRDALLDFHCCANYQSESSWVRKVSYEGYRQKWLSTSQPESFLGDLARSMDDARTIAEIWTEADAIVGYLWVTFTDVPDYSLAIAEVRDVALVPSHRGRGIGTMMLEHVEKLAKERGARLLRSEVGIGNTASEGLHLKAGFRPYRTLYEKVLGRVPIR